MREIKFRAWANGTMWHVNGLACTDESEKMDLVDDSIGGYDSLYDYDELETRVLMQYTGLKDKNGKEIYEGDIVSTDLSRPYLIVEFRNGAFMYQCHHGGQDYYDHMEPAFEDERKFTKYHAVIGNIYENPELLK